LTIIIVRYSGNINFDVIPARRWQDRLADRVAISEGGSMETIYFLILWIGAAILHTLYELKVKPYLDTSAKDAGNRPFFK
jgi:hypothetical protein